VSGASVREAYDLMIERVKRHAPQARINGVTVQRMARVRGGREISIGVVSDDPFGPVIVFGAGGVMIELIADRAMELPPLNQFLARRLIERSRVARTLGEWRGAGAADVAALERVLLRVSEMVCALPQLREMDLNPIIVDEHGAVAVDARIVVDGSPLPAAAGTPGQYAHLAILPYPTRYEQAWTLRGGGTCHVRPIRPDDAQMLQALVRGLTPESRYFRFVSTFAELPAPMLSRFTLIDYDREMALVAVVPGRPNEDDAADSSADRIVGVARYVIAADQTRCEFSLVVAEDMKGLGLGGRLMESIMEAARERGLVEIVGYVLRSNAPMLALMKRLGFAVRRDAQEPDFAVVTHAL
jgi:acetyltransferase